jgi:hypothetical protein
MNTDPIIASQNDRSRFEAVVRISEVIAECREPDELASSPWRNDSECASEDEMCGNEKWVLSGGQPGE